MQRHPAWPPLSTLDVHADPWEPIQFIMELLFLVPKDSSTLHRDFNQCFMRTDESPEIFYGRLDDLALACMADDNQILVNFYRGLTPPVRKMMGLPDPSLNLQSTVRLAVRAYRAISDEAAFLVASQRRGQSGLNTIVAASGKHQALNDDDEDAAAKLLPMDASRFQQHQKSPSKDNKHSSQQHQSSPSKQRHESNSSRGKSRFKSKPRGAPPGPGKTLGTTPGAICAGCGFDGHTIDQCGRVKAVAARLREAKEKGLTVLALGSPSNCLMITCITFNQQSHRQVMWDTGAG